MSVCLCVWPAPYQPAQTCPQPKPTPNPCCNTNPLPTCSFEGRDASGPRRAAQPGRCVPQRPFPRVNAMPRLCCQGPYPIDPPTPAPPPEHRSNGGVGAPLCTSSPKGKRPPALPRCARPGRCAPVPHRATLGTLTLIKTWYYDRAEGGLPNPCGMGNLAKYDTWWPKWAPYGPYGHLPCAPLLVCGSVGFF